MTVSWPIRRLDELADVGAGNPAPQGDVNFLDGTVPFFRTSDVGRIHLGELHAAEDMLNNVGAKGMRLHPAGTVLLPKSGASTFTDHRVITTKPGYVSSHLATVKANGRTAIDRYLYYALQTISARDIAGDSSYPTLSLAQVRAIKVPAPPLCDQLHIVTILDEGFAGIDAAASNAEQNLVSLGAIFDRKQAELFEALPNPRHLTLAQVSKEFGRGKSKHRPRNDPGLYEGDFPFIQTGDVRNADHVVTKFGQTYNERGLAQSKLWPAGTLCITIAANIAETAILGFGACFPDSVIGMVVDEEKATPDYVLYCLQHFKKVLLAKGKGSAQDNINLATFESTRFPFPGLDDQRRIASDLFSLAATIRELEEMYTAKRVLLAEFRQSLLAHAFTGELTREPLSA